jgi:hypothetical protein
MSSNFPDDPAARDESEARAALIEELERRIEEIEVLDDAAIGSFTGWDWLLCVIGSLVLPALAMWWYAG